MPFVQQSPFVAMLRHGIVEQRYDLTSPKPDDEVPLFEELRGAGMTEWLGRVFPFGELAPQAGNPLSAERVGDLWLVCSLATDRPEGFSDDQMEFLRGLLPVFALAAKATTLRAIGQGLLAAYLGDDPAARVLAGTVQRGEVQGVEAVLFYRRPARLHRHRRHPAGPRPDRACWTIASTAWCGRSWRAAARS